MDDQSWVTVYTHNDPIAAEIIKNALDAEGIRCNLDGIHQAAEPGLIALSIKVQVPPADAEQARTILLQHERAQAEIDEPAPRQV